MSFPYITCQTMLYQAFKGDLRAVQCGFEVNQRKIHKITKNILCVFS